MIDRFVVYADLVLTIGRLHPYASILYYDNIVEVLAADPDFAVFIQAVSAIGTAVQCDDDISGRG